MKTVAILAQKGGVGKTTLAVHLAVASSGQRNTAIIDLDPQASAARWADRREADVPVVLSAHGRRLAQEKKRIQEAGGELLIVDTAPHSSASALEAAKVADLILIPCRSAILDLEAVGSTLSLVRTVTPAVPVFVVLNGIQPRGRDADEAAEAVAGLGVDVAPARVVSRVLLARALVSGQAAEEVRPSGKAAWEIAQVHAFICAQLNLRGRK